MIGEQVLEPIVLTPHDDGDLPLVAELIEALGSNG